MSGYRLVPKKTNTDLGLEWDALADLRNEQISSGSDITFNKIMAPFFIDEASKQWNRRALDAGCGTGQLANLIFDYCGEINGVDLSAKSVEIATRQFARPRLSFSNDSIQSFANRKTVRYNLVVANMVLMDVMDLGSFIRSVRSLMIKGGRLLATLTHPAFWPRYYGFEGDEWFNYSRELCIEGPFKISADYRVGSPLDREPRSTQVHRPIAMYVNILENSGFQLSSLQEMMPEANVSLLYPEPWAFPRYLAIVATAS